MTWVLYLWECHRAGRAPNDFQSLVYRRLYETLPHPKVKAVLFVLCKMKIMVFCRFSVQRKKGTNRNQKVIKPRSCWQNTEEHT